MKSSKQQVRLDRSIRVVRPSTVSGRREGRRLGVRDLECCVWLPCEPRRPYQTRAVLHLSKPSSALLCVLSERRGRHATAPQNETFASLRLLTAPRSKQEKTQGINMWFIRWWRERKLRRKLDKINRECAMRRFEEGSPQMLGDGAGAGAQGTVPGSAPLEGVGCQGVCSHRRCCERGGRSRTASPGKGLAGAGKEGRKEGRTSCSVKEAAEEARSPCGETIRLLMRWGERRCDGGCCCRRTAFRGFRGS